MSHPERLGAYDAGMVKTLVGTPDPDERPASDAVLGIASGSFVMSWAHLRFGTTTTVTSASSSPLTIAWMTTSSAGRGH